MRRLISHFIVCTVFMCSSHARGDDFLDIDKVAHVGLSSAFSSTFYLGLTLSTEFQVPTRMILSSALALVPGVAKEIVDAAQTNDGFSGPDLFWDAAGAMVGAMIAAGIERLWTMRRKSNSTQLLVDFSRFQIGWRGSF